MRSALLAAGVVAVIAAAGVDRYRDDLRLEARAAALTGGDPAAGARAIKARSCGGCHQIPGVAGASGTVGPPLASFAGRGYIAGRLVNSPENLEHWIQAPHAVDPETAMPETGVGHREAADIAAYLYSRR
jgi:cytochrome c2